MQKRLFTSLLLLALCGVAQAQTGKLAGRIVDDRGEPIIGATVQIIDTPLGAAADLSGDYVVLQIPPGSYRVRFSSVGYQTRVVENVSIASNQTTTLNATLPEEVIQGEEVVVTAEKPIVDVTETASVQTISRDEIAVLPVQNLNDVVNLQAGVVEGHFRGGRLGEVQYQVNGVSVNNPYNNQSTIQLDRSVLQEVQVISGTFDAEYGQALSGVVNAVLRTGNANEYEFSGEVFMGDYYAPGDDSVTVRDFFVGQRTVAQSPYISRFTPTARQNYQLNLSGPVPFVPNTTFLVNGQRILDSGYLYGIRRFMPTDSSDFEQRQFNGTGDGDIVPIGFSKRWAYLGKLTTRINRQVSLSYQAIGGYTERQGYSHAYRFNPEGTKTQRETSLVHGLDLTHTLSNTLFYEVSARQNLLDYKDLKYDSAYDPRYFEAGQPRGDANYEDGAFVQGVDLGRFVQKTNQIIGKGTVTWQATKVHLVKAGIEVQSSNLEFGAPGLIRNVTVDGRQQLGVVVDTLGAEVLHYKPLAGAAYVQDRVEWGDLRVRMGLRAEYFDANSEVPGDLQNPANSIQGAPTAPPKATTPKLVVAPRLSVSFPILDRASLFFSYGHFYQLPALGQFFSNSNYIVLRDLQAGAVDYGVLGNPDLKPEFTAQYEFGFKSVLTPWLGVDVSLFYKDIRDLLGVEFVDTYTAATYARLTNVDFGGVRGFTVSLDQRGLGALTTSIDYTLQIATGNSSDPRETANRAAAGGDPRPRQVPFQWDQRHTLNLFVIYNPEGWSLTGIARFATGQPYTPSLGTGFGANLETNSGRKPGAATIDLRAERGFRMGGLQLTGFARVFNLLNARYNNGFVYADTGSPFYTLDPAQQRNPSPTRLAAPRRVEVGISFRGIVRR